MREFLVTVVAYQESLSGPIKYQDLRGELYDLGLRSYLVNDDNEWIELPEGTFAMWVTGEDSDTILSEWNRKLGTHFGGGRQRGAFLVAVGTDAAWQAPVFD